MIILRIITNISHSNRKKNNDDFKKFTYSFKEYLIYHTQALLLEILHQLFRIAVAKKNAFVGNLITFLRRLYYDIK